MADFIENKVMRGDGDQYPWVDETCKAMKAKGATFFRVSHPLDKPDDMWLEGWIVKPEHQGPHPWECPA